jgi:DNA-binding MarR family transcriptional regulator
MKDAPYPDPDPLAERFGPLARHLFDAAPLAGIWRLSMLSNFFTGPLYARLQAEHGLGRPGFVVLYCLSERGGLMARDVVLASGLPKNSVSRAVTDLVAKGLVRANASDGDRRAKRLGLTERGTDLMRALMPAFAERQADLMAPLTPAERETLHRLLARMAEDLPVWVDRAEVASGARRKERG